MNRHELFQWVILVASVIYAVVAVVLMTAVVVYRFQNPALTETQLFLAFAPYVVPFFIVSVVLGYVWRRWM